MEEEDETTRRDATRHQIAQPNKNDVTREDATQNDATWPGTTQRSRMMRCDTKCPIPRTIKHVPYSQIICSCQLASVVIHLQPRYCDFQSRVCSG